MGNKCLFHQNSGLGDLIWLLRAHDLVKSQDYNITWPIIPSLFYIKDYLWNDIDFVETVHHTQPLDYDLIINFQDADRHFPGESVLKSKYKILDLDWYGWQDSFLLKRNYAKENELFNKLCPKEQPYTVVCRAVGTPPNHRYQDVFYEKDGNPVIEIGLLDGYNPFDYCTILEHANQVSTVDSCWQYIAEKLSLTTDKLFLTSRFQPPNWVHIDGIFEKPWKRVG